jgi:RNA polymerase sigma-70 factor (ECF subfamily)
MSGPDQELLARFVGGDRRAFDELMRIHEDRVFAVCLRITGNRQDALDATQDTFVNLYRKAHQYHGGAAVSTWLYRIAVNTCYDLIRKSKRRAADSLPETFDPVDPSTADQFHAVELRPDLQSALAAIPTEYAAAVVLADVEGMALADVSEVLGVPVGTVKSRVFRGRRLLAERLGNRGDPSGHPRERRDA